MSVSIWHCPLLLIEAFKVVDSMNAELDKFEEV